MTKRTKALLLVGVIFISSMAGCLSEVSSQVEAENTDLKTENAVLNSTIANLTLENQNLSSTLATKEEVIHGLEMILSVLENNLATQNQSILNLETEAQIMQLQNQILLQEMRLQSIEYNASIEAVENIIIELDLLLSEANSIISEYSNGEGGLMNDPYTPLLFESHNFSEAYMNHEKWNGGLWERVIFDDNGVPKVQYSHGLEYVPTTAFHWGLVCISKWIVSGNQSNFDDAMEIAVWAVENQSANGGWGWYFNHSFHGGVLGDMYSGWYGAMTQGLGMSFMARMYAETSNESFKQSALDAMKLFDVHVDQGGVLRMYNGQPWYEEYPTPDAGSFVLNGYIYALIGLHDLHEAFNSTKALELYTNGTDSLYSMIGLFDLGCSSSYDLVHHSVPGTPPNIARDGYHSLHISLFSVLNVFENDGFQAVEDRWIGYANEQCFNSPNGANA
ncbi:D-glucuronyl C5-epimerase family protein [Candidatus Poseidoniales archaeon]|nr:D-glucuronyl C5-epimerase family protein [Candidatus Poseidoniales archaeon]